MQTKEYVHLVSNANEEHRRCFESVFARNRWRLRLLSLFLENNQKGEA